MNKYLKILGAAAILSSSSFAAQAVTVGGVTWDPDHPLDFSGVTAVVHQDVDASGVLSGYGRITTLNGQPSSDFCSGCELTFVYGGYTPGGGAVILPGDAVSIDYSGGFLNMYVDITPDAPLTDHTLLTAANTGSDGGANALWLSTVGHAGVGGFSLIGTAVGPVGDPVTLSGLGRLDVTGGLAQVYVDTDTISDTIGGFADFSFSTSFTIRVSPTSADGSGNFQGLSVVPEPASLGIFALGLLGMAGFARKRKTS